MNSRPKASLRLLKFLAAGLILISPLMPTRAQESPAVPLDLLGEVKTDPAPRTSSSSATSIDVVGHGPISSGWAVPVNPGEVLEFSFAEGSRSASQQASWSAEAQDGGALEWVERIEWSLPDGTLSRSTTGAFRLRAPSRPGNYRFSMVVVSGARESGRELGSPARTSFDATLLVKYPFDRKGDGVIEGMPIGVYPNEKGADASYIVQEHPELYQPPSGFFLVTPEIASLHLSQNFRIRDFSSPLDASGKSFLTVDPRLLQFLEAAIVGLPGGGSSAGPPIKILLSFLSPHHLDQLENQGVRIAKFTRYQYGDAAAVIWDTDGDNRMDDLNQDGEINADDAQTLADRFAQLQKDLSIYGGIGVVGSPKIPNLPDTPYVDIDMRGVGTRW